MNSLEKLLASKNSESNNVKDTIFNNNYDSKNNEKDLSYLDKFLKIITSNHKIDIIYADVPTASMNIETGNITLPNYVMNDRDIYIMMGSHEVSHVLHTPRDFYDKHNKSQSGNIMIGSVELTPLFFFCINIVEDIRIEKIIRRKYPGFVEIYNRASKKILDGLFEVTEEKWNKLTIADKINVKAKCTNHLQFELTPYEDGVLKYMKKADTFNDVLVKAAYLYKLIIDEKQNENLDFEQMGNMPNSSSKDKGSGESDVPSQTDFDKLGESIDESDSLDDVMDKIKENLDFEAESKLSKRELDELTTNTMDDATDIIESSPNAEKSVFSIKNTSNIKNSFKNPQQFLK